METFSKNVIESCRQFRSYWNLTFIRCNKFKKLRELQKAHAMCTVIEKIEKKRYR